MEFSSRNIHKPAPRPVVAPPNPQTSQSVTSQSPQPRGSKALKALGIVLFISAVILTVAAIASIALRSNEAAYVDKNNYQVVTLADKQAYFGKITKITNTYIVLTDVYYIQGTNDQNATSSANTTLVKRGCEIHKPQDQMTIRQDQVDFWENLQSDGQVAKAIAEEKKTNLSCEEQVKAAQEQAAAQQTTANEEKKTDNNSTSAPTSTEENTTP
jgi:hypothetical protein